MTLQQFEGRDVVESTVSVTKAGDGLSAALEIAPVELRHKQVVQVILECEVGAVTFKNATEGEGLIRVHKLVTSRAQIVEDPKLAKQVLGSLNDLTERLAREGHAKGSMPGQTTIDTPQGDEGEGDGDEPGPFPTAGSVDPALSGEDLDAELAGLTGRS